MPFSRSRSIESSTRSATSWLAQNAPDCHSIASTSVVLPWSTWATIATLRRSSRRAGMASSLGGRPLGSGWAVRRSAAAQRGLGLRPVLYGRRRAVPARGRGQILALELGGDAQEGLDEPRVELRAAA